MSTNNVFELQQSCHAKLSYQDYGDNEPFSYGEFDTGNVMATNIVAGPWLFQEKGQVPAHSSIPLTCLSRMYFLELR